MMSIAPSVVILGLVAIAALRLALQHSSPVAAVQERRFASRVLGIATAMQSVHFVEEWMTGFHILFPALLGLEAMPLWFFVPFNLVWIAIWLLSMRYLRLGRTFAFFVAWFLAIAAMLNGLAHPIMAVASGGYFPGLITSPLIGLAGVILWKRLKTATSEPGALPTAS